MKILIKTFVAMTTLLCLSCSKSPDINEFIAENYNNPMGIVSAAVSSGYDILEEVIAASGADVNFASKDGFTALMTASVLGKSDQVEILLSHGANVSPVSREGMSAISYAAMTDNPKTIRLLAQAGANVNEVSLGDMTPLITSVNSGNSHTVKALLESGADVNHQDSNGDTALMYASWYNKYYDLAKLLIQNGANPSLKNSNSDSPLSLNLNTDPKMTKILTSK